MIQPNPLFVEISKLAETEPELFNLLHWPHSGDFHSPTFGELDFQCLQLKQSFDFMLIPIPSLLSLPWPVYGIDQSMTQAQDIYHFETINHQN